MHIFFSQPDKEQLAQHGISEATAARQLTALNKNTPTVPLAKPATIGDGIVQFSAEQIEEYSQHWQREKVRTKAVKFVPASGAASRMFKHLHDLSGANKLTEEFFINLSKLPFAKKLLDVNREAQVAYLLDQNGLNYSNLPKALIPFHTYKSETRTALEEHIAEGILYAIGEDNELHIHFTVSPEHEVLFQEKVMEVKQKYKQAEDIEIRVSYSYQKKSTDALAADGNGKPFRNNQNKLLFRPAGHGALLHNLNNIDADIIFIKNIDNVQPDHLKHYTATYKSALAGYLLFIKEMLHGYLDKTIKGLKEEERQEVVHFINKTFQWELSKKTTDEEIISLLNRPIRVCGMVKNEGEPGGGPFWVNKEGKLSLQIVEKSQVNLSDSKQAEILARSTHFNPVDVVCSTKSYSGTKYNLEDFVDEDTYFISDKYDEGNSLKAFELPGLWNGAMANWNTIFVEVPLETFSPVKTVNDLLKPQHQPL